MHLPNGSKVEWKGICFAYDKPDQARVGEVIGSFQASGGDWLYWVDVGDKSPLLAGTSAIKLLELPLWCKRSHGYIT